MQLTADLCDERPVSFPENRDDDLCGTKSGNRCFLRENPIRYVFDFFVFRIYDLSLESEILRKSDLKFISKLIILILRL